MLALKRSILSKSSILLKLKHFDNNYPNTQNSLLCYIKSVKFCDNFKNENNNKIKNKTDDEYEKQIKKELEKTDKERERQKKIEEWKLLKNAVYTKEEFEQAIKDKSEISLIEISESNIKKLFIFKKICLFFNIPVSLFITFFIDSILPAYEPGNKKMAALYYGFMATDYILFVNGVLILSALANICLNAKYLPKENMIEFTKVGILNKPYIVKEKIENVKRTNQGLFSPFNSLKSKATNQIFALRGIGEWKDIKLYNYLFPFPQKRTGKTELIKDRPNRRKPAAQTDKTTENIQENGNEKK